MPFALSPEDELKKQQEAQGTNISGSSTAFNVPGQSAGASSAKGGPKSSGQFQNIQKYLQANQGQAQQMGEKIGQGIESKVQEAQSAGESLKSSVKAPTSYDPNKVLGNLSGASEQDKTEYNQMKQTGGYTGPKSVYESESYQPYQQKKSAAETALKSAGTEEGQMDLLRSTYQRPSYTRGAQSLDQAIFQQSPEGKTAISGLQAKYQPLLESIGAIEGDVGSSISQAKQAAEANKALFAPAEQATQKSILDPIEQRVAYEREQAGKFGDYQADLSDLELSNETMNALGLDAGTRTYGLNLASYLTPATTQASVQNVATAGERQKYNDLMNFLGINDQRLGQGEQTYQGISSAKERLLSDIAGKRSELENAARSTALTGDFGSRSDYGSALERDLGLPQLESTRYLNSFGTVQDVIESGLTPEQYIDREANKYQMGLINRDQMISTINNLLNQFNYNDQISVATNKQLPVAPIGGGITGGIKGGV